jgi:hypothetical protein
VNRVRTSLIYKALQLGEELTCLMNVLLKVQDWRSFDSINGRARVTSDPRDFLLRTKVSGVAASSFKPLPPLQGTAVAPSRITLLA